MRIDFITPELVQPDLKTIHVKRIVNEGGNQPGLAIHLAPEENNLDDVEKMGLGFLDRPEMILRMPKNIFNMYMTEVSW